MQHRYALIRCLLYKVSIDYVRQRSHSGHILRDNNDVREDIMFRRNILYRQINNVLCFSMRRYPLTKLKLLSLYHSAIAFTVQYYGTYQIRVLKIYVERRKGLRRALDIPADTHSRFLPEIAGTLPVFDELVKRKALFTQHCLSSDNKTVSSIANMAVFSLRMSSPLGRNAFCCLRYGVPLT